MDQVQDTNNSDMFNQAMETEGHVKVTHGISFDEIESLTASDKAEATIEAKKEAEVEQAKKDIKGDKVEKKAKTSEKPKKEEREAKGKDKKVEDKPEAKEEEVEGESKDESKDEDKPKAKLFKYKMGDQDLEISGDTKFEVKVDGEKKEATFQDLLNNYSGKEAVDKRFADFNKEREVFLEEKREIDDTVNEIVNLVNSGKPDKALVQFFSALGASPQDVMGSLREQFRAEAEKMADMSEEQKEAYMAKQDAQQYKEMYESRMQQDQVEANNQRLNSEIQQLQQQHNIDDKTFNDVAEELLQLQAEGRLPGGITKVTPAEIVKLALYDRTVSEAQTLLSSYSEDLSKDREVVRKVVTMKQSGLEESEIKTLLDQKYATEDTTKSKEQVLSDKIRKNNSTRSSQEGSMPQHEDVWDFAQI